MRKSPLKRKSKTPLAKSQQKLWELCKQLTRKNYGYNCYTCGQNCEAPHTGHFISSSVCSAELRYDLGNLRPQCYRCNIHLSGNWLSYEARLTLEKGEGYVQALKKRNQETKGKKYDIIWYEAKIKEYDKKLKEID